MRRVLILLFVIAFGVFGSIIAAGFPDLFAEIKPEITSDIVVATPDKKVAFSHENSFFAESVEIELIPQSPDAVIYYTLDGSDPTLESEEYREPILLKLPETAKATTIKAIAVKGGETSEIFTKSYVVGKDVFTRFDENTLVFVLSTDPYNLYDYYYGIAIEGYLRDEYKNSDEYNGGQIDPPRPANYNMRGIESEREMYVEVFDNLGNKVIDQAAGARVVGGWSRASSQKSFRLFARNIYSEGNGMFKYPFFTGAVDIDGQPLLKYDRITLRNGGNDREQAGIRDELSLELAKQAGFPDVMEARPAAIFLNGEYYGFSWLKEAYCNGYLEQTYGGNKDNYQILSVGETGEEGDEIAVGDYKVAYDLALNAVEGENEELRFENDEIFGQFCDLVDIENLLLYYAIEVFVGNRDWPSNNVRLWRYYPSEGESITSKYHDGKWRFMLFDAEFGWGLYNNGYLDNTLRDITSNPSHHMGGQSIILTAVLQRDDMKEKFANYMCDLISGPFSSDNAKETLIELGTLALNEQSFALDKGIMGWANIWTFWMMRQQIVDFADNRPSVMLSFLQSNFKIPEDKMYKVIVTGTEGAEIHLNSQKTAEKTLSGEYFSSYKVDIGLTEYMGYEFDYWEIDGVRYQERDLKLGAELCDSDNEIKVTLSLKEVTSDMPLVISKIQADGKEDKVELYNPNDHYMTTNGYYMTDDPAELKKWTMPTVTIPPRTSISVAMNNNKSIDTLQKLQANFSLKKGETLILSDSSGEIFSKAVIYYTEPDSVLTRNINGTYTEMPS